MKKILIGLAVLPFLAGSASAANRLSNLQLDTVAAGQFPAIDCPGCTLASSSSASTNGVTTSSSSSTTVPPPTPAPGGGSNGGGNGPTPPSAPSVLTTIAVPSNLAGILNVASATTVTH